MQVLLITDADLKEELLTGPVGSDMQLHEITTLSAIHADHSYDACIDLLFEPTQERIKWLKELQVPLIVVNSVITTLKETDPSFIRINGWPTFLRRTITEAAASNDKQKEIAEKLFLAFGKKIEWVPDVTGFIIPRVIASVINEAFFALEENVSSREEIDTAMKLGTNYPFGPFEWSSKIGQGKIHALLSELSKTQERYKPSSLLEQTA